MANENKQYAVGEEVTVKGIVTRVGDNAGRTEYSIAVEDSDVDYNRPINLPAQVDSLAFTNGYAEYQKELLERPNYRTEEDTAALGEDAQEIRANTDTPDPRDKAAGNANVDVKETANKPTPKSNVTTKSTSSDK